jgi:hypothetical protein
MLAAVASGRSTKVTARMPPASVTNGSRCTETKGASSSRLLLGRPRRLATFAPNAGKPARRYTLGERVEVPSFLPLRPVVDRRNFQPRASFGKVDHQSVTD